MAKKPLPSPELLRQLLRYEPETGRIFSIKSGKELFCGDSGHGYKAGNFQGRRIYAHRAAIALTSGQWPDGEVDHINGDGLDNRIENLRVVSHAENALNAKLSKANTSGTTGVSWDNYAGKWRVITTRWGKRILLERFENKADAINALKRVSRDYGFHKNHGRKA